MTYKIGFVDEDPLQVKKYKRKLKEEFDVVSYTITKNLPLENLLDQIYNSDIDLLMVDYLMTDKGILTYNGDEVVRRYEEIRPRFPMIIFTNEERQARPEVDNPNIIYSKRKALDEHELFCEILRKNIELYTSYKNKRKSLIASLLEKSEKEGLNAKEKHKLSEAQFELRNLDKRTIEMPEQLLEEQKLEKLKKTAQEAYPSGKLNNE